MTCLEAKLFMSRNNIPIILSLEKTHPLTHCSHVETSSQTKWHEEQNPAKLHISQQINFGFQKRK